MMDTNKLIRLLLLSVGITIYLYFLKPKPNVPPPAVPGIKDGIASVLSKAKPSMANTPFAQLPVQKEKYVTIENEHMQVLLSTKGGMIKKVMLKKHKDQEGKMLVLLDEQSNYMELLIPYKDAMIPTSSLYFQPPSDSNYHLTKDQRTTISFRLPITPSQYVEQSFEFIGNSYEINYTWKMVGMEDYLNKDNAISFYWQMDLKRLELDDKDFSKSTINYYLSDETFDGLKETKSETKHIAKPMKWVAIKQCFFSSAIVADDLFTKGDLHIETIPSSKEVAKTAILSLVASKRDTAQGSGGFKFFFGPNVHNLLKKVSKGFEKNLPLGWTLVRWVNTGLTMPLFSFLEKHISNYGIIIFLMVIILKLLLLPLSYKSYKAMVTMRIIKPELDKIKEKHGNNLQKVQTEQLLLYKELGINPLSGSMPLLLQMPILLAMFNFFPNMVSFRQVPFLWAKDLSTYDRILSLPFTIPVYGNHVSLFTLLMVASTILYTKATNPSSNDVKGVMKGLSYIMPITFMFMLNSFPAGLSFYYFVSNMITFLQQKLINAFSNEESIKSELLFKQKNLKERDKPSFSSRVSEAIQFSKKKK